MTRRGFPDGFTVNVVGLGSVSELRELILNEFDESKHPRDERGRFTSTGGGADPRTGMSRQDKIAHGKRVARDRNGRVYGTEKFSNTVYSTLDATPERDRPQDVTVKQSSFWRDATTPLGRIVLREATRALSSGGQRAISGGQRITDMLPDASGVWKVVGNAAARERNPQLSAADVKKLETLLAELYAAVHFPEFNDAKREALLEAFPETAAALKGGIREALGDSMAPPSSFAVNQRLLREYRR
jgi:hypothetical protein